MSATTADETLKGSSRFAQLRAAAKKKLKAVGTKAKDIAVSTGTTLMSALRKTGRVIKKIGAIRIIGAAIIGAAIYAGLITTVAQAAWVAAAAVVLIIGIRRTVAYLGLGISWVLRAAISLIAVVFFTVVSLAILLVSVIAGVLMYALTKGYDLWVKYIHSAFAYLRDRDTDLSYVAYRDAYFGSYSTRWENRVTKVSNVIMRAVGVDQEVIDIADEKFVDETMSQYGEVDHEDDDVVALSEKYLRDKQAMDDRAEARRLSDVEATFHQFPGSSPFIANLEDPYDVTKENEYTTGFKIFQEIAAFEGSPTDFDFSPYTDHSEMYDVFTVMSGQAISKDERAYWMGRREMVKEYMRDPKRLETHGKTWALVWQKYKSKQADFPLKYLRAGFMDQAETLKQQEKQKVS